MNKTLLGEVTRTHPYIDCLMSVERVFEIINLGNVKTVVHCTPDMLLMVTVYAHVLLARLESLFRFVFIVDC